MFATFVQDRAWVLQACVQSLLGVSGYRPRCHCFPISLMMVHPRRVAMFMDRRRMQPMDPGREVQSVYQDKAGNRFFVSYRLWDGKWEFEIGKPFPGCVRDEDL